MRISLAEALASNRPEIDLRRAADAGVVPPSQFMGVGNRGGTAIQADWDHNRAIQHGYKACAWVFACIDRLAGACSQVPWRVLEKRGGEWEAVDGHPLEQLIERPNELMSRKFMVGVSVQHLNVGGNALQKILTVTRGREAVPSELWPLAPPVFKPVPVDDLHPSRTGRVWIEGYKRLDRPGTDLLPPEIVIHSQFPDPSNLLWGMSPMQAVRRTVDMDVKQVAWNATMPDNMMVPPGAFVDRNLKTDPQLDEAAARLKRRYQASENARVPLMLGDGSEWLSMAFTPVEMDWIESRRFSLLEICAVFRMIPSLFMPDSTYSNQDSAVKHLWKNGAAHNLGVLEDAFNLRLVPFKKRASVWVHYDLSVIPDIQDTLPQRLEAHERAVRSGIPPNRSFILLDLPIDPVPGGDKPLVLGTLVPLEQLVAEPEKPPAGTGDAATEDDNPRPSGGPGANKAPDPAPADGADA